VNPAKLVKFQCYFAHLKTLEGNTDLTWPDHHAGGNPAEITNFHSNSTNLKTLEGNTDLSYFCMAIAQWWQ